ncbi:MAG: glycine dehydrogenase (aminomethyl-transferring) [Calditrichaeota bacterium]|nr:aminomethyl-transferring glycine dehydrogenase [Calditrichota bacterium]RQV99690.1 MAG: glycine dehydrogenase (aminomethyl-transferring) [Calditrichota bacterium]
MQVNYQNHEQFKKRQIGPDESDLEKMLKVVGVKSLNDLIDQTIPGQIRLEKPLNLPEGMTEYQYLRMLSGLAKKNKVFKSYIGLGFYDTVTPGVIQRNIFENPGWYTQYTPYQAEIAQGRLEALLAFQTMVSDLTGMEVANASLLDEATAAAEAMTMVMRVRGRQKSGSDTNVFLVADNCLPQTIDVLKKRAEPLGIKLRIGDFRKFDFTEDVFGMILQYPAEDGAVYNYRHLIENAHQNEVLVVMAADLLSLAILTPPGELGADVAVGSSQRFGVPLGFGGPHAAYFATREAYQRQMPGRLIGVSIDRHGNTGYRMALQTREQHIRREKATSNICTAQALLAIMAGMYAIYHGPEGLQKIAGRVHALACILEKELEKIGFNQTNDFFFDTLKIKTDENQLKKIQQEALKKEINFRYIDEKHIGISLDETTEPEDLDVIIDIFASAADRKTAIEFDKYEKGVDIKYPVELKRTSEFLTHPVFHHFRSETKMMRYIKSLERKDLSLTTSMIPLGSCTMKLNPATAMLPVSWPEFSRIHPFVPEDQVEGYLQIIHDLEKLLCEITGFSAASMQPNSGAQGEYTGLSVIQAYHQDRGENHRNITLIPTSAHGTNPASAVMAGTRVVLVQCNENGDIDVEDLRKKAEEHKENLAAIMVTYPSTHGVFEEQIQEVCEIVHQNGGLVYMDGANMNAQVGFTTPGRIGADVCHLNLHKTFGIPHGGGGPGMGPICVAPHLEPYLPDHPLVKTGGKKAIPAVSATPYGSSSILLISYAYIRMLGRDGLEDVTRYAILNANYVKSRLENKFPVLYRGKQGRVGHELIFDMHPFKKDAGIEVEDVSKRLMDYGFHAPTTSFPVLGTLMFEPTESESRDELDRFCEAMLKIYDEIQEIVKGTADAQDNVLKMAPHTAEEVTSEDWQHLYSREKAAFPAEFLKNNKFWPAVARVDNTYGDRNLMCACPPVEEYEEK